MFASSSFVRKYCPKIRLISTRAKDGLRPIPPPRPTAGEAAEAAAVGTAELVTEGLRSAIDGDAGMAATPALFRTAACRSRGSNTKKKATALITKRPIAAAIHRVLSGGVCFVSSGGIEVILVRTA